MEPEGEPNAGQTWHVYIVRCADGSLYTGVAIDVDRRMAEHRAGASRAARYVRGRGPLELVFSSPAGPRGNALRAEHAIRRLRKRGKEALVSGRLTLRDVTGTVLLA